MRAAIAGAALALALAACSVEVEGARCDQPGSAEQCPSGQACGVDGRCSERAAQCTAAEQRCAPGVDRRCSGDARQIETCTDADPCGAWAPLGGADDCGSGKLVCGVAGPSVACVCAVPAGEIAVDAAAPEALPSGATGALEPTACRFRTLGAALVYAKDVWQPAHAGASVIVRAHGAPEQGAPVVFDAESFPLVVAPGVTLAPQGPAAADWVIVANAQSSANAVEVHDGGTLEGFTIRGGAGATGHAVHVVCGSATDAVLKRVVVDGAGALTRGVSVVGACGASGTDVRIASVNGPGLFVDAALADAAVPNVGARIDSGWIEDCVGSGAEVRGGALTLNQVTVVRNGGFGVKARTRDDTVKRAIAVELNDCSVEENGEAGLLVRALEAGSSMKVRRSTFTGNRASTQAETGFTSARRAGGVYLSGVPPATQTFEGNEVYGNANADTSFAVDQLVAVSGLPWNLAGGSACGAVGNVFACPGNGKLVYGSGAAPIVHYAYWPTDPPALWPPESLVTNADFDPTCPFDAAPVPACPAPPTQ